MLCCYSIRSCWLELSALCVTEKIPPPSWQLIDKSIYDNSITNPSDVRHNDITNIDINTNQNINSLPYRQHIISPNDQGGRVIYLCFLTHYYLELQQGEKALKVRNEIAKMMCFYSFQRCSTQLRTLPIILCILLF